ncbi:MAG: M48 family metalloprotease [Bryobacteraceae bacterium]|nr:M48 family metalloprotease [Bryobacteraceae bacterium]
MAGRIAAVSILLFSVCASAQKPKNIKPSRWNFFSPQQDVELGKEAAGQIEQQVAIVNNDQLSRYVASIGGRLAKQSEAGKYPYTFKVVYDKSINAFALPGGPAYIHTGLISQAENEAQIAGVLAHEIAHVALRHGTAQVSKANAAQLLAGIGGAMLGGGSMLGQLAQLGAGLGANSLLLKFSRDAESDADLLGARMMAKAGYDPVEMARFFEKLEAEEKKSGRSTPQFMSDHPSPGNRVKAVQNEVKMMPKRSYTAGDAGELQQMQKVIQGLPVPAKANTNFRKAGDPQGARPAAGAKQYRSQGIAFQYPENWQVIPNQQGNEITIAHQEGLVDKNGQGDIAYGAVIGLQQTQSRDLRANTEQYLKGVMQGNGLQLGNEGTRQVQVSGSQGLLHVLYGQSAFQGQREVVIVVTADHPAGLLYMILISPENEYKPAQPAFERMITSLEFAR